MMVDKMGEQMVASTARAKVAEMVGLQVEQKAALRVRTTVASKVVPRAVSLVALRDV